MALKHLRFFIGIVAIACAGCASDTTSICQMPANRHFWQGTDVHWSGEIIDISAPPHGSSVWFTDYRCGMNVRLDPVVVPTLYATGDDWDGHSAVADFEVAGRLSYQDGDVVFVPTSLKQTSAWASGEGFYAYMRKRLATLAENGVIESPPE
ncbi:hypothetical protein [Erythrobacter colymbi]|uniref:hypothetical protein n=1 Tax=Erythrobacter colymbi TaxID=1161202 RepID=UPI000A3C97B9|nr:hypothetical protein [Erythrobacter colymbi]